MFTAAPPSPRTSARRSFHVWGEKGGPDGPLKRHILLTTEQPGNQVLAITVGCALVLEATVYVLNVPWASLRRERKRLALEPPPIGLQHGEDEAIPFSRCRKSNGKATGYGCFS